jgi:hypothetical protein
MTYFSEKADLHSVYLLKFHLLIAWHDNFSGPKNRNQKILWLPAQIKVAGYGFTLIRLDRLRDFFRG